ncbi:hypothetical protein Pmani_018920 [Petrolisthes manimaculis]|uniref:Putative nuclease HARBI1 n=1 Tax=Petrolisthes manimaculis TaxID=1843537 RepID=A0AAE1U3Z4_9EUCA|nr:hypothetical protein Pmani_018920 [Petrolisthes manimaculis]
MTDAELIKRYRLDRAGIMLVTDLVRDNITSRSSTTNPQTTERRRKKPLTPETKIRVTLRYLATGKIKLGSSRQTVINVITETLNALSRNEIIRKYCKFPIREDDCRGKAKDFQELAGMPGVIGVIDATHIRIKAPEGNENVYINKRGLQSINAQFVFDAKYRITNVEARWPGSSHDVWVLNQSAINLYVFEKDRVPKGYHFLADRVYPSRKWLLIPYLKPEPGPEADFNRAHKKTWSVVERGIDQLKRRFQVLDGEITISPTMVCQIVRVCALLHNICKDRNISIPADGDMDIDGPAEVGIDEANNNNDQPTRALHPRAVTHKHEGRLYRNTFVNLHYT